MSMQGAAAVQDRRDTVSAGPLEIDRTPVTNARYAVFVEETGHRPPLYWPQGRFPKSLADHPVVGVDFFDAFAFALWAGGALPTELEWVLATGLDEPRAYVWGDRFDASRCNTVRSGIKGTTPVDAYPGGVAPSGALDMCGNVWELTCSPHKEDPWSVIVKGGSWYDFPVHAKIDACFRARMNRCLNTVGFRLVYGRKMRLPEVLDPDVAAKCIAYRRQEESRAREEAVGGDEFASVVEGLRAEAAAHIPELDLPRLETGEHEMAEALSLLDVEVEEGADESEAPAVPTWRARCAGALRALRLREACASVRRRAGAARAAWRAGPKWPARVRDAVLALRLPDAARKVWARLCTAADELFPAGAPPLFDEARDLVRARPRAAFLASCVIAGVLFGVVAALFRSPEPASRAERLEARGTPEQPAPAARVPDRPAPARRRPARRTRREKEPVEARPGPPARDSIEQALRDVVSGVPRRRDEGERFLIWHADESYPRVKAALEARVAPAARSSLRYVLTAIEEERNGAGFVQFVHERPTRGLVVFCDVIDSRVTEEIAKVRRTAKAERIPATVVFMTNEADHVISSRYGRLLGAVRLYVDRQGALARELHVPRLPAVAGMREGGRLAFLLLGNTPRSRLAASLKRLD